MNKIRETAEYIDEFKKPIASICNDKVDISAKSNKIKKKYEKVSPQDFLIKYY